MADPFHGRKNWWHLYSLSHGEENLGCSDTGLLQSWEFILDVWVAKQGENDVTQYYNDLTKLWQELDLFNARDWKHPDDAMMYKKMVDNDRIYDFLAGN